MIWQPYRTTAEELARAFMTDAKRDMIDAQVLCQGSRWPATVTSALHSIEKAFKALLIVTRGDPEIPITHLMLEIVENEISVKRHLRSNSTLKALRDNIFHLQGWLPKRTHEQNSEYPWFDISTLQLLLPEDKIQQHHASEAVSIAEQLLTVVYDFVQAQYGIDLN